jgi:ribosomal protein S18 acetylase RimI-like enzyme
MVLTIRKATIEDWQSVQKLNHEVFQVSYKFDKNLNMNWPFSPEGVAYYKKAIESESYFCHIAEADEVSVGYIIGVEQTFPYRANRTGEIENIGVTSKFRGRYR